MFPAAASDIEEFPSAEARFETFPAADSAVEEFPPAPALVLTADALWTMTPDAVVTILPWRDAIAGLAMWPDAAVTVSVDIGGAAVAFEMSPEGRLESELDAMVDFTLGPAAAVLPVGLVAADAGLAMSPTAAPVPIPAGTADAGLVMSPTAAPVPSGAITASPGLVMTPAAVVVPVVASTASVGFEMTPTATVYAAFFDSFARGNSTSIGTQWTENGGDLGIISNALAVQGTSNSRRCAIYNTQLATPYQSVEFTIATTPNTAASSGAVLRCNSAMTQMVILSVASTQWALGSITGINGTFTSIGSFSTTISVNDVIRVTVDSNNVYRVYINGVRSGPAFSSSTYADTSHRYVGLFVQRTSTSPNASASLKNFTAWDTPAMALLFAEDFNRTGPSLGANWMKPAASGGTLVISGNEISGVGTPSVPVSFAMWRMPGPVASQAVRARVRWNGRDPAHSAASVCVRANIDTGHNGVHFWFVRDLMGICIYDDAYPNGFLAATGTADYVSTTKFAEGAWIHLEAEGTVYTALVNNIPVLQGTFTTAQVPLTNRCYGVQIQDDSAVSGGGEPPANLDDVEGYMLVA